MKFRVKVGEEFDLSFETEEKVDAEQRYSWQAIVAFFGGIIVAVVVGFALAGKTEVLNIISEMAVELAKADSG